MKDMYYVILGEQIKELRKARDWSQEDLADRMKVSRACISSWEQGRREPNVKEVDTLCDIFGVTSEELLYKSRKYLWKDEYV